MKKFLTIILSLVCVLCLAFSTIFSVGCGDSNENEQEQEQEKEVSSITLDKSTLSITEFETSKLKATLNNLEGSVAWSSSNVEIATVDQDGNVSALKAGSVTITAKVGSYSATCAVTVNASTKVLFISVDSEIEDNNDTLDLITEGVYTLSTSLTWGTLDVTNEATITYSSSDEEFVTVNEEGFISAIKEGSAVITITASARNKTATYTINVNVSKPVPALSFADYEGITPNSTREFSAQLQTINLAGAEVDKTKLNLAFDLSYLDNDIDTFNMTWVVTEGADVISYNYVDNNITVIKEGNAKLTLYIDFNFGEELIIFTAELNVVVSKPVQELTSLDNLFVALNREYATSDDKYVNAVSLTLSDILEGETITSISLNDKEVEDISAVSIVDGQIKLPSSLFSNANKEVEMKIATTKRIYSVYADVDIVDFAIANKTEFFGWYNNYKDNLDAKINLIADIDFEGEDLGNAITNYWWTKDTGNLYFMGTFNGQGHTLSNFTATVPVFSGIGAGSKIMNLAMVNFKVTTYGLLACSISSEANISDCYIEGTNNALTNSNGILCDSVNGGTINNLVVVHHDSIANSKPVMGNMATPTINNAFIFDAQGDGNIVPAEKTVASSATVTLYTNYDALLYSTLPYGFDEDSWIMFHGIPMLRSAVKCYESEFESEMTVGVIQDATSINMSVPTALISNKDNVTWTVNGLNEGDYTISGNNITLADTLDIGTEFTITGEARLFGIFKLSETTETITVATKLNVVESGTQVIGFNLKKSAVRINLEEGEELASIVSGTTIIDTALVSIDNNVLSIPVSCFTKAGDVVVVVKTDMSVYTVNVKVADYSIGSVDEFNDWYKIENYSTTYNQNKYIVLTDNIDLSSKTYGWVSSTTYGAERSNMNFNGTFDGQGYNIDNFNTYYGFVSLASDGTVKNVSFTNVYNTNIQWGGGFFAKTILGTVSNVYYSGTYKTGTAGTTSGIVYQCHNAVSIENFVVVLKSGEVITTPELGNGIAAYAKDWSSMYIVNEIFNTTAGSTLVGAGVTTVANYNFYESVNSFKNDVLSLPDGFSADMWEISADDGLVMKKLPSPTVPNNYFDKVLDLGVNVSTDGQGFTLDETFEIGMPVYKKTVTNTDVNLANYNNLTTGGVYSDWSYAIRVSAETSFIYADGLKFSADTWYYVHIEVAEDGKAYAYVSKTKEGKYAKIELNQNYINATQYLGQLSTLLKPVAVDGSLDIYITDIYANKITEVQLDNTTLSLTAGDEATKLTATLVNLDGTVNWNSSDDTIATVDSNGNVTPLKEGSVTITARLGAYIATCEVTVAPKFVGIKLNKTTLELVEGGNASQLTASLVDVAGTVSWSSSDDAIVTVDTEGNVTPVAIGTATITATLDEYTATCEVTVNEKNNYFDNILTGTKTTSQITDFTLDETYEIGLPVYKKAGTNIATFFSNYENLKTKGYADWSFALMTTIDTSIIYKDAIKLKANTWYYIHVVLEDYEYNSVKYNVGQVYVSNSQNGTYVKQNLNGAYLTSVGNGKNGPSVYTCCLNNLIHFITEETSFDVYMTDIYANLESSVKLDNETLSLTAGDEATKLTATLTNLKGTVNWNSSDDTIATVDTEGNVTPLKEGSVTITANVGEYSATCEVTVAPKFVGIKLDNETLTLKVGDDATKLTATLFDVDGTVTWSSSDDAIAIVDTEGNVTPVAVGTATITATLDEYTATCEVTVEAAASNNYFDTLLVVTGSNKNTSAVDGFAVDTTYNIGLPVYKKTVTAINSVFFTCYTNLKTANYKDCSFAIRTTAKTAICGGYVELEANTWYYIHVAVENNYGYVYVSDSRNGTYEKVNVSKTYITEKNGKNTLILSNLIKFSSGTTPFDVYMTDVYANK